MMALAVLHQTLRGALGHVVLNGNTIHAEIADTEALRDRGLGGRDSLAPNTGMLFVFAQDGQYAFWMKDMKFAIDMIWIAADGRIVYIAPNISPDTYPKNFAPTSPARYVLEVAAGYSAGHDVKVGDQLQF
jgi:uncharacterized membrane protein (UPF0127 family)